MKRKKKGKLKRVIEALVSQQYLNFNPCCCIIALTEILSPFQRPFQFLRFGNVEIPGLKWEFPTSQLLCKPRRMFWIELSAASIGETSPALLA